MNLEFYRLENPFAGGDCDWVPEHEAEFQRLVKEMERAGDDYEMIAVYLTSPERDRLLELSKRRIRPEVVSAPISGFLSMPSNTRTWEINLDGLCFSENRSQEQIGDEAFADLATEFKVRRFLRRKLENALRKQEVKA